MRKRKHESDQVQLPDSILGHDPFEDLDVEWLDREEGERSMEALGHDPFEDMDMEWLDQESVGAPPALAEEEGQALPAGIETTPISGRPLEFAAEPTIMAEMERLAPPPAPRPLETRRPTPAAPAPTRRPAATFHFPADFKWGVATSAHQVEGNNTHNDWWAWEQKDGHVKGGQTSGLACNWWKNAEADLDRVAAMGLNALRLSVEWSRIEPRPGTFDDGALARYSQILQGLRERNVEPMVTLHHFTNPLWLAEQGGWENPQAGALFARFVRRTVEALGQYCDLWCTINEPNVYAYMGYLEGIFPPGRSDPKAALIVIRQLLAAHAAAYREIHAVQPHARVGLAHNMRIFDPANPRSLLDRRAAEALDKTYNQAILIALVQGRWTSPLGFGLAWRLRRTLDWIGLNYYTRDLVAYEPKRRETLFHRQAETGDPELLNGGYGEFYPRGMFRCLQRLARLGLPIYVTENGIPGDDEQRPRYMLTHLHQMWRALQFCYPVMGYYHWTLVDNFEWNDGWMLRFGLIGLDPQTQARTPRRSAEMYGEVARANAITPQAIDTYAPQLRPELLPG